MRDAVAAALYAPSVLNTQPWRWRLAPAVLELRRDTARQLSSIDPQGRMLTVSCGAALHHAIVLLSARGYQVTARRLPDEGDPELLARLTVVPAEAIDRRDLVMAQVIRDRHTDRRPIVAARRIDDDQVSVLETAATRQSAWLHQITEPQRPIFGAAMDSARAAENDNEAYRRELEQWTRHRPADAGVSFVTVVAPVTRPVAVRDFAAGGETGLHAGLGDDPLADYLVVATATDRRLDWLRAGEATSAVWLTATANRLAMSAMSEVIEVPDARAAVAGLLSRPGHPQLVLRVGRQGQPTPPPRSSRRSLRDVLEEIPPR